MSGRWGATRRQGILVNLLSNFWQTSFVQDVWWVLVLLGIMIVVHELGHYWAAIAVGVRVDTFSIGFGPRLFGWRRGVTDFRVSALPFGGYVRMLGEMPGDDHAADPESFQSKSRWQRAVVVIAGLPRARRVGDLDDLPAGLRYLVLQIRLVLERIGLEIPERERLVRDHVVRELDHLDVEPMARGHLLDDFEDLGVWSGRDADPDRFGPRGADQERYRGTRRHQNTHHLPSAIGSATTSRAAPRP